MILFAQGSSAEAGAVLAAAPHPSGQGLVTGGDDGRLVWSRDGESQELASLPGRWLDAVATSSASGLIAFSAGRDLHVRDAARGIVLAAERYDGAEPVNLGSGREVRIAELATLLKEMTGYPGRVEWDADKPNGQPRRCLDTRRAAQWFGFRAEVPLEEGLRETVEWYRQACTSAKVA